jgi:hypothetical protein
MLVAWLSAGSASAQETSRKLVKIAVGAGAIIVGTTVAAKSSQTDTVTIGGVTTETSSHSNSQLITGLSIAGIGGIVLWRGLREHDSPTPVLTMGISPQAHAVFFRRSW